MTDEIGKAFRESITRAAEPLRGLRVLLFGFSGRGFPGGDGAFEAVETLPTVGIETAYTHHADPARDAHLSRAWDVIIFCTTKIGYVVEALPLLSRSRAKRVLWFWDLRPGSVAAALRGQMDHGFITYSGMWRHHAGAEFSPDGWRKALGCPIGYAPQGSPLRPSTPDPADTTRIVFIGDLKNRTYHADRAALVRQLGGVHVVNARDRSKRLEIEAQMPRLYPSARYCLSVSPAAPGYTSVRTYSILACGGLLLCRWFPGCEALFVDGEEAVVFDGPADAARKLEELDDDEPLRLRIAHSGRRRHAREHTVAHRVLNICREAIGAT